MSLPNITYALGYLSKVTNSSTYTRKTLDQSGVYIRIYRKRTAAGMTTYGGLPQKADGLLFSQLDMADDYFLLAEFRADSDNHGHFYDSGEFLPDYNRRLRAIHGYQTLQFYPKPDKRYVTDIRCVARPQALVDDQDTPLIHAEAIDVLIHKAMVLFYESLGQPGQAANAGNVYREQLITLSKRYGDLRPPATPVLRRMSRATNSYRSNNYYRKWYESS